MRLVKFLVPAAAALVAGCGGGSSESSEDPFPLAVGDQWEYRFTDSRFSDGLRRYDITGTQTVDGVTTYLMQDTWKTVPYAQSETEVRRYPGSDANDDEIARGPLTVLKLPLTVGDEWTSIDEVKDSGEDIDGDGTNEVYTTLMSSRVTGMADVDTPLGRFLNAYTVMTSSHGELKNPVTAEVYDWTDTHRNSTRVASAWSPVA